MSPTLVPCIISLEAFEADDGPINTIVDAVIFDLDGTITDTEKYYQITWKEALAHFGYKAEPWMTLDLRSLGRPYVAQTLKEWFGEDFDFEEVYAYCHVLTDKIMAEREIRLKPAPDTYIYACRELGIAPGRAFAVEDSPNGVRSAHGAGCKVIMVHDLTDPDEELKKLLYARVDTLLDIKELVYEVENDQRKIHKRRRHRDPLYLERKSRTQNGAALPAWFYRQQGKHCNNSAH